LLALVLPCFGVLRRIDDAAVVSRPDVGLLQAVPFLGSLPETTVERLAAAAVRTEVAAGEGAGTQGETGDRFYVVAEGGLGVRVHGTGGATLHGGGDFAEVR